MSKETREHFPFTCMSFASVEEAGPAVSPGRSFTSENQVTEGHAARSLHFFINAAPTSSHNLFKAAAEREVLFYAPLNNSTVFALVTTSSRGDDAAYREGDR